VKSPYATGMAVSTGWYRRLAGATVLDAALVGALFATDLGTEAAVTAGVHLHCPALSPPAVLLAGCGAGVLWLRRSRPILVFALVLCIMIVAGAAARPGLWTEHTGVPLAIAAYAIGSWSDRPAAAIAAPSIALLLAFGAISRSASVLTAALAAVVLIALPWMAGRAVRSRRLYLGQVERQLARAEHERDEHARQAVLDERRHLARELHDVVAHHVSLIGVQAGAARTTLDHAPDSARQALLAIEESSRSAVGEMRRLLEVLDVRPLDARPLEPRRLDPRRLDPRRLDPRRLDAAPAPGELEPQPGLGRLDELAETFRQAGLAVDLRVRGDAAGLSPLLELCCYRLIEQALTNVTMHSAAATASAVVAISETGDPAAVPLVQITVRDPGPALGGTSGSGRGLVGMRERAALFGGTLSAGPSDGGGFTVDATLGDTSGR
jgi:signal transduction histidine kinase